MKPTCPFKTAGFDKPDECDEGCAWLCEMGNDKKRVCAVALVATREFVDRPWTPANCWKEAGE